MNALFENSAELEDNDTKQIYSQMKGALLSSVNEVRQEEECQLWMMEWRSDARGKSNWNVVEFPKVNIEVSKEKCMEYIWKNEEH